MRTGTLLAATLAVAAIVGVAADCKVGAGALFFSNGVMSIGINGRGCEAHHETYKGAPPSNSGCLMATPEGNVHFLQAPPPDHSGITFYNATNSTAVYSNWIQKDVFCTDAGCICRDGGVLFPQGDPTTVTCYMCGNDKTGYVQALVNKKDDSKVTTKKISSNLK